MSLIAGTRSSPLSHRENLSSSDLDDLLGLLRLAFAFPARFIRRRAKVVDIVEIDVVDRVEPFVEVARHAHVDQEHRAVAPLAHDRFELAGLEHRFGGRDRSDHYVGELQVGPVVVVGNRDTAQLAGKRSRAIESAIGNQQRLDSQALQMARGQLRHLAGPHQHHGLVFEPVEDLPRQRHRRRTYRDRAAPDKGDAPDPLGDREGAMERAVEHQAGGAGLGRLRIGDFQLTQDLRLAHDHRVETRADAEQMARGLAPLNTG